MASIYGVQIKGYKTFHDHEGMIIGGGNIYLNGKKLGYWQQDSWGGPDNFEFDEHLLDEVVEKYKKSGKVETDYLPIFNADCFIYEIVKLMDVEKEFKKCVKAGYPTYVRSTDGFHIIGYYTRDSKSIVPTTKYFKEYLTKNKDKVYKNVNIEDVTTIYDSLDDFCIA